MDKSRILAAITKRRSETLRGVLRQKLMDVFCTDDVDRWMKTATDDDVRDILALISEPGPLPKREANPEPGSPEPSPVSWFTFGCVCGMWALLLPIIASFMVLGCGAK